MAADDTPSPAPAAAPRPGGTVEPAQRTAAAKGRSQAPADPAGVRYELRDPFAEVTYRARTMPEMVAKADQLGSIRFTEIAEDGKRTAIEKVDGEWRRGPQRAAAAPRPVEPQPARDDVAAAAKVIAMPGVTKTALAPREAPQPEPSIGTTFARIDAEAERAGRLARLESALHERYVIKRAPVTVGDVPVGQTEYRFRGDTTRVAFTESTFKLATDTNSPSVARSMVDVAEARNWKALRVSGNEDFKRMVWLEASVRGVKAIGYEPQAADLELLRREREARQVNRIEPVREGAQGAASGLAEKASGRGGGGRKAVLAAVEAVLVAQKVPAKQREAVMEAAADKLGQRVREGQAPKVKVYDRAAPSQRQPAMSPPEVQRSRDRAAPGPAR